jgi:hypothetical protein
MLRGILSAFLLSVLAGHVAGAESEAPAADAADETAEESGADDGAAPEDIDAAMAEEIRAAEAAAADAPPVDSNEPFIPSVQISEDLSVSFPVDI